MLPTIAEWTTETIKDIATSAFDESIEVEKKASLKFDLKDGAAKRGTLDEIAKQVCAFANASGGFLVFGVNDASVGGGIDSGVRATAEGESTGQWIENQIPRLVYPQLLHCRTKFIAYGPQGETGAVVLYIPPSDLRPHWILKSGRDIPYLRTGGHSAPMSLQTFRDIQSRGTAPYAIIEEIDRWERTIEGNNKSAIFRPSIQLISGPVCERWAMELKLIGTFGSLQTEGTQTAGVRQESEQAIFIESSAKLYPKRQTYIPSGQLRVLVYEYSNIATNRILSLTLYADAAPPIAMEVNMKDLFERARK